MSRSSNDTAEAADSDDVDSGVSPEHVHAQDCPDSQESDVALFSLFRSLRHRRIAHAKRPHGSYYISIMLEIMLMLIARKGA